MYTTVNVDVGFLIAAIVLLAFFIIAGFLSQVFMGLAIYNDAKARRNDNAGMWGVLTGFFSWIPAIIYFCIRNQNKTKLIPCASCGFFLPMCEYECPSCRNANPYAQQFYGPEIEAAKKNAKGFFIALICMYVLMILLFIAFIILAVIAAADSGLIDTYYY